MEQVWIVSRNQKRTNSGNRERDKERRATIKNQEEERGEVKVESRGDIGERWW